jgi:hypothetical protein
MQNHGTGADGRGKQSRADAAETGDQKNRQRQQQHAGTRDDESTEKRNREQWQQDSGAESDGAVRARARSVQWQRNHLSPQAGFYSRALHLRPFVYLLSHTCSTARVNRGALLRCPIGRGSHG